MSSNQIGNVRFKVTVGVLSLLLLISASGHAAQKDIAKMKPEKYGVAVVRGNQTFLVEKDAEYWLRVGDRVVVEKEARATIALPDMDKLVVKGGAEFVVTGKTRPGQAKGALRVLALKLSKGLIAVDLGFPTEDKNRKFSKVLLLVDINNIEIKTRRMRGDIRAEAKKPAGESVFEKPHHIRLDYGFVEVLSGRYMMHIRSQQDVTFEERDGSMFVSVGKASKEETRSKVMFLGYGAVIAALSSDNMVKAVPNPTTAIIITNLSRNLPVVCVPWSGTPRQSLAPGKSARFPLTASVLMNEGDAFKKLVMFYELLVPAADRVKLVKERFLPLYIRRPRVVDPGPHGPEPSPFE